MRTSSIVLLAATRGHQEVTPATTVSRDVERAKTRHDLVSGLDAATSELSASSPNGLNDRLPTGSGLSRVKISVVHLRIFATSSSAAAPRRTCHRRSTMRFYSAVLEMTLSESSFK
jgi:hypothetical protein